MDIFLRNLNKDLITKIDERAKDLNISRNVLITEVIENYATRLAEDEATHTVHTQLDSLMINQNRLIEATNNTNKNLAELMTKQIQKTQKLLDMVEEE